MSELEKELQNIERIYVDQNFSLMVEAVRTLNDLLVREPTTEGEASELVDHVNKLWRENGLHSEPLYVTGLMDAGGLYSRVSYESLDSVTHYRNKKITSKGFFLHVNTSESVIDDDIVASIQYSILMKGFTFIEDESGVEGVSEIACAVDLRSAEVVYREMTPARAAAWLEEYYPEIKLEIDGILLNADTEADAIMALRDVVIPVEGMTKKRIYKIIQYLCHWMLGEVRFDRHFPYHVAVDGELDIFNPVTLQRDTTQMNDFIAVHARELSVFHDETRNVVQFGLTSEIIEGPLDVARPVQIPLYMIQDLVSTRT